MGSIKADVKEHHLREYPGETQLLTPFLSGFDVTRGARVHEANTDLSVYFLRPEPALSDLFGLDHEVMLVVSDYATLEPRTIQAVDQLFNQFPARGRVDQTLFILVARPDNAVDWVDAYVIGNPESRVPAVFSFSDLISAKGDDWFVRNVLSRQLYARDLFNYQLPVNSDLFFFGRDALVTALFDSVKSSQNRGLFGLRKTGKTSILYKVKRLT